MNFILKINKELLPTEFNIETLKLDFSSEFKKSKRLGKGGFAEVYSVTKIKENHSIKYAMKILIQTNF